jgi:hypothetical protein
VIGGNVTITGNTIVTATFSQNTYTLTVNIIGNGSVTKNPDQATYHYSDVVALTATPNAGWTFISWSANVVGGNVTINGDTTVIATFKQNQAALIITGPVSMTYGDADADITYTGGSGTGAVTFSAGASTACSIVGDKLHILSVAGTCEISATKAADTDYNSVTSASFSVTIAAKEVTVTADNQVIAIGDPDPTFTFDATGFVAPDDFLTAPTCSVAAPHTAAGTYDIDCSGGDAGSNYSIAYVSGTLTVTAVNNPPTDIALTSSAVNENQPVGTVVGALSTTDPDALDTHTYSFCGGTDDASFQISGSSLQTNVVFDFETKSSYSICIRSDDGNGGTFDETFPITVNNLVELVTVTFKSFGPDDGWSLESGENTNRGGSINFGKVAFRLGDTNSRKQYRGILSFPTASLPDNAIITKVTLRLMKEKVIGGGDPVSAFQGFLIDIRKGTFGTSALQTLDVQAAANKTYGPFVVAPTANWYSFDMTTAKAYINKMATGSGLTQIRLRFQLDDDNNAITNYLTLYSGNAGPLRRPQLIIEYRLP